MSKALLNEYLKRLKLPAIAKNYEQMAQEAEGNNVTLQDYLCSLLELEIEARDASRKKERLTRARFPMLKTLESFNFDEVPSLDRKIIFQLAKGTYLADCESIIMIGPHGLGKTHLAIGLGIEACQSGKHVKFFTAGELVHQLVEAKDEKRVLRLQQQLARVRIPAKQNNDSDAKRISKPIQREWTGLTLAQ